MRNNSKYFVIVSLILILAGAAFLRIYKLAEVPPSISWDEASVGYNAYTISHWGKDEWGKVLPITFKSFGDDKSPIHVYLTAVSVGILGLNIFSTRLPMAVLGVANILLIFLLAKTFFKNNLASIISAFLLAVSPYAIQFSRFNHEAGVTLFFFMLGLYFFLRWQDSKKLFLLTLAAFNFLVSMVSYHSAKLMIPAMMAVLAVLYYKELSKNTKALIFPIILVLGMAIIVFTNQSLLGLERMKQTAIGEDEIRKTGLYQQTSSLFLGKLDMILQRYRSYFTKEYLFLSGDRIERHATQSIGEFYKVEALFLIAGLLALLIRRDKVTVILLSWALLAPIPASFSGGLSETGHAARALFMMGSWNLISAFGFYKIITLVKKPSIQMAILIVGLILIGIEFRYYLYDYYQQYSKRSAIEWQYGMGEIGEYVRDHNGYFKVYMTGARSQPYIFLLYYLQTPLPDFLKTVQYNEQPSKLSNLVASFDRYQFTYWDPLESPPDPGVLYVLTPSEYDGLRHRSEFSVKKKITYPNGNDAYFLVSYP